MIYSDAAALLWTADYRVSDNQTNALHKKLCYTPFAKSKFPPEILRKAELVDINGILKFAYMVEDAGNAPRKHFKIKPNKLAKVTE